MPVFLSSLVQLPAIVSCYAAHELIAILTANGRSLEPMRRVLRSECGIDPFAQPRFVIVGCESVPGFEAVERGEHVDYHTVAPAIVALCRSVMGYHPTLRAFVFECTQLPPFSDHVRAATRLPVFDAIAAADWVLSAKQDNIRFGLDGWQAAPRSGARISP